MTGAAIGAAAGAAVIGLVAWAFGVRIGFRRGFHARMGAELPPAIAKSRQLTKAFGRGLARQARAAHMAELRRQQEHARAPRRRGWMELLRRGSDGRD